MITKIFGGPGTGKTTWMLSQLEKELDTVPLDRIAFVTHTVAAKEEALSRIRKKFPGTTEKDVRYLRTIHGICYLQLGLSRDNVVTHPDLLQFADVAGIEFSEYYTKETDVDGIPIGFDTSSGNALLNVYQLANAMDVSVFDIESMWPTSISRRMMRDILHNYSAWKRENGLFDFVDMINMYQDKGDELPIDVLFIDEAQDLSNSQWKVIAKFMGKAQRVYIAGDDDQSIYAFIGAAPYGFLEFPADRDVILPITYRLKPLIWDFAKSIISNVKHRMPKDIKCADYSSPGIIDYYSRDIDYLGLDGQQNTMIIARHNNQLTEYMNLLRERGIPYTVRGKNSIDARHSKLVSNYFLLKQGKSIDQKSAAAILRKVGNKDDAKRLSAQARQDPGLMISAGAMIKECGFDFSRDWTNYLAAKPVDKKRNDIIKQIIVASGIDAILEKPKVDLTTYHGSKGREAKHVICLTDCYRRAFENDQVDPDDERRLSYVGASRAIDKLTIVQPKTNMYMRSLS